MKKDKYYGTTLNKHLPKAREIWGMNSRWQFRIVCKAKSMAEANIIAVELGLDKNTFNRDNVSETGNMLEIELADKYGFIIRPLSSWENESKDITEVL